MRHFLDLKDFSTDALQAMLDDGLRMKAAQKSGESHAMPLAGKTVAMIFEKPSTRTRVSFEVGVVQLGGTPLILSANDLQLGRGESVEDTARVLSRYVDVIMIRCFQHETLLTRCRTCNRAGDQCIDPALAPLPADGRSDDDDRISWPACWTKRCMALVMVIMLR
jgi:ornithine carbamoyltransferase